MARAIGLVEACRAGRGAEYPFQGTIATTDGESLWVFRYSSQGKSRSLFFTRDVHTLRQEYPDTRGPYARCLMTPGSWSSEPVGDLPGAWIEDARSQLRKWSAREATSSCHSPPSPRPNAHLATYADTGRSGHTRRPSVTQKGGISAHEATHDDRSDEFGRASRPRSRVHVNRRC
jgi:hypothetical protein